MYKDSGVVEASPQSETMVQVEELFGVAENLATEIKRLEHRLTDVLHPSYDEVSASDEKEPELVPLAAKLRRLSRTLEYSRGNLSRITSRLGV